MCSTRGTPGRCFGDLSAPTIICVDDEPIVLESLRGQLETQFEGELDIEVAQDALEALEIIGELSDASWMLRLYS